MKKEELEKELQSIAPYLSVHKKKDPPFKVPDNYFEQFENQLLDTIEIQASAKPIAKVRKLSNWLSRAAAIFILGAGAFYLFNQEVPSSQDLLADLSTEEIDQYLAEHIYELEEDLFYEDGLFQEDLLGDDFSEEEIDIYLEEHLDELESTDLDKLL